MAEGNVVEKLVVAINYKVDPASEKAAKGSFASIKGGVLELEKAVAGAAIGFASLITAAVGFSVVEAKLQVQTLNAAKSLDVSVQEYSALIGAFKSSGLQADQLSDFLFQLQGQISGAADGSADLVQVFNKMGIAVRDSNGNTRKSVDVFYELSDGLKNFGSAGERASAIQKLLGENGTRLNTIFEMSSQELRDLAASSAESNTISQESAEASLELEKSLVKLSSIASGLGRTFANELIPKITPLVKQLSEFLSRSDGIVKVGLPRIAREIGNALDYMATPAGKAATAITALAAAIGVAQGVSSAKSLLAALGPAGAALTTFGAEAAAVALPLIGVALVVAAAALAFDELQISAAGGEGVLLNFAKAIGEEKEGLRLFNNLLTSINLSFELMGVIGSELGSLLKTIFGGIYSVIKPVYDLIKYISDNFGFGLLMSKAAEGLGIDSIENINKNLESAQGISRRAIDFAGGGGADDYATYDFGPLRPLIWSAHDRKIELEKSVARSNAPAYDYSAEARDAVKNSTLPGVYVNIGVTSTSKEVIAEAVAKEVKKKVVQHYSALEDQR